MRGSLSAPSSLWFTDVCKSGFAVKRSMHIHINEMKSRKREEEEEKAWSVMWRGAALKVGLSKAGSSRAQKPENTERECMEGAHSRPTKTRTGSRGVKAKEYEKKTWRQQNKAYAFKDSGFLLWLTEARRKHRKWKQTQSWCPRWSCDWDHYFRHFIFIKKIFHRFHII